MPALPYQPWAAAAVRDRKADHGVDDPHVRCLPDNPPRPWVMPHLVKAVHTSKLLVLLYEVNAMYRQIRPQDIHTSMDGENGPENRTRYRVDGRDMPGKREVVRTTSGRPAEELKRRPQRVS